MQKRNAKQILKDYKEKGSDFWISEGKKRSLEMFQTVAQRVPAYKDFLKKHDIAASKITTWADFLNIPTINKDNYLREYPLEALCWDGSLERVMIYTSTSGSTGKPFYFPRKLNLDWQYSVMIRSFLENSSCTQPGPILVINGFSMGVWIGGLITYNAFEIAATEGEYPLSIITPGINKDQILAALKNLAPMYSQTIIIGYPPFVKDMIDAAIADGIDVKKLNLRLLFAAEGFGDTFRDYLVKVGGIENRYLDTMNIYGSADIGAMAAETPVSIMLRTSTAQNQEFFSDIYSGARRMPTVAQYNPLFTNFEAHDEELILTGDNAIPLIRYSIGDQGGVFDFDRAVEVSANHGVDLLKKANNEGLGDSINKLPFVYLYERKDMVTTLFGLQIYPEHIREALLDTEFHEMITGKFTLETKFDELQNQYLEVNVEMKKGYIQDTDLQNMILSKIVNVLREMNSEFNELHKYLGERAAPKIVLWGYGNAKYFKEGVKQVWVKKNR